MCYTRLNFLNKQEVNFSPCIVSTSDTMHDHAQKSLNVLQSIFSITLNFFIAMCSPGFRRKKIDPEWILPLFAKFETRAIQSSFVRKNGRYYSACAIIAFPISRVWSQNISYWIAEYKWYVRFLTGNIKIAVSHMRSESTAKNRNKVDTIRYYVFNVQ